MSRIGRTLQAAAPRDPGPPLPVSFYRRPAEKVAEELLGCWLVRRTGRGQAPGALSAGRIVETEAYVGEEDRACHAHVGRTARNDVMYGPPGRAYVYFIYGMYDMMNVVCQPRGVPEAVLVRALEPVFGIATMRRRRRTRRDQDLANGPGKLCRALRITRALNGVDLRGAELWIAAGALQNGEHVRRGPRIGVDYAGSDARRALRFWADGNANVSRAPRRSS
jgi:DNA-3-methyladenine glycosylase